MKRKYNAAACILTALALALTLVGLWMTAGQAGLVQYVLIAPQDAGEVARLVKEKDKVLEDIEDSIAASAVTAVRSSSYIAAPDAGTSAQATLRAGGEGFFEVFPRYLVSGRLLSETELRKGENKAVLDEDLAFKLFPTVDPIGQTIVIDTREMEVVGVVRHARRVGEADLYSVYAPLAALADAGYEIVALSAKPVPGSGAEIMFEDTASGYWQDGGFFYDYEKEVLRARLPVLYTAVIFGFAAAIWALKRVNALAKSAAERMKRRLKDEYAARFAPQAAIYATALFLAYAVVFGGIWLIASAAVEPLYIFPEWVPENIVEWSDIRDVFWNLAVQGVKTTNAASGEMRALQFWGGVIGWGVTLLLTGVVILVCPQRRKK